VITSVRALKGHGTENDFVLIPDLDGEFPLTPQLVRRLCDRHSGLGADGVLRVVRTEFAADPAVRVQAGQAEFFMDYSNADGSVAEMCGNGVRVFARFLLDEGLVDGDTTVATRSGPKPIRFHEDLISVEMGEGVIADGRPDVTVRRHCEGAADMQSSLTAAGRSVNLGNPHVVVELKDLTALAALDLSVAPTVVPSLPDGQNVEFVVRTGPAALSMRVYERGVGETRSCGTGICAAVLATVGAPVGQDDWTVTVPGGSCEVGWAASGSVILRGPAVLVADLQLSQTWLADVG
jgi:diaminopimelate epimerase